MGILLGFAPFFAFAVIDQFFGSTLGLAAGALTSAALILRGWLQHHTVPKVLEAGTVILFAGLALYAVFGHPTWSVFGVRLAVDAGLLAIVLISLAIRKPFTLQYAREQVSEQYWNSPTFVHVNTMITAAWGAAFVVIVAADALLTFVPGVSPTIGVVVTVAALFAAFKFTTWYPERQKGKAA